MTTLRQRMIEDMRARNLSPATQRNYIHYLYELAKYFMRSPDLLEPADIKKFQIYLLHERKLSAHSVNQSIAAMKFFFNTTLEKNWSDQKFPRVKPPQTLPEILSQKELARFFDNVRGLKHRTALMVCYGAGLRVSDVVKLTAADIDAERMTIRIQQGKGSKDRYALLSPKVLDVIRFWQHQQTSQWGTPPQHQRGHLPSFANAISGPQNRLNDLCPPQLASDLAQNGSNRTVSRIGGMATKTAES